MKKSVFILYLLLFSAILVYAADAPTTGIGSGDVESIQETIDQIPIDAESGTIDTESLTPIKSKAEERIATLNKYVGKYTKLLWGVELEMSWIFIFSFVVWILLIELILSPVSQIADWDFWWSLIGSMIIASLAMHGFGDDFVVWMTSLMNQWYVSAVVLVVMFVVGAIYFGLMKVAGKKFKKIREDAAARQTAQDRAVIHLNRELAEQEIKNYSSGSKKGKL